MGPSSISLLFGLPPLSPGHGALPPGVKNPSLAMEVGGTFADAVDAVRDIGNQVAQASQASPEPFDELKGQEYLGAAHSINILDFNEQSLHGSELPMSGKPVPVTSEQLATVTAQPHDGSRIHHPFTYVADPSLSAERVIQDVLAKEHLALRTPIDALDTAPQPLPLGTRVSTLEKETNGLDQQRVNKIGNVVDKSITSLPAPRSVVGPGTQERTLDPDVGVTLARRDVNANVNQSSQKFADKTVLKPGAELNRLLAESEVKAQGTVNLSQLAPKIAGNRPGLSPAVTMQYVRMDTLDSSGKPVHGLTGLSQASANSNPDVGHTTAGGLSTLNSDREFKNNPQASQVRAELYLSQGGPEKVVKTDPNLVAAAASGATPTLVSRNAQVSNAGDSQSLRRVQKQLSAVPLAQGLNTSMEKTHSIASLTSDGGHELKFSSLTPWVQGEGGRSDLASTSSANGTSTSQRLPSSEHVHEQVMRVIADRRVGQNNLSVQLSPAHLGKMEINFLRDGDGEVNITIVTREPGTREFIDQFVPRVRQLLQESGVSLGQLDVRDEKQNDKDKPAHGQADRQMGAQNELQEAPEIGRRPTPESGFYTTV